jgi:hypothetical protein
MDSSSRRGRFTEDEAKRFGEYLVYASCIVHHGQEEQQGREGGTLQKTNEACRRNEEQKNEQTKKRRRNRVGAENSQKILGKF